MRVIVNTDGYFFNRQSESLVWKIGIYGDLLRSAQFSAASKKYYALYLQESRHKVFAGGEEQVKVPEAAVHKIIISRILVRNCVFVCVLAA